MPFVIIKTGKKIDKEKEENIKAKIGCAIEDIPGKNEDCLLIVFESDLHFYLRGKKCEDIAYIEINVFGNDLHLGYSKLTDDITNILANEIGILHENIYIKYSDIKAWGVSGMYINTKNVFCQGGE